MARDEERVTLDLLALKREQIDRATARGLTDAMRVLQEQLRLDLGVDGAAIQVRLQRQGGELVGIVTAGGRGGTAVKGGGAGRMAPRRNIEDWVRKKGITPTGRQVRGSAAVTSVAVAIQRSLQKHGRAQRAVIGALRAKAKRTGTDLGGSRAARRSLQLIGRVIADAIGRAGR